MRLIDFSFYILKNKNKKFRYQTFWTQSKSNCDQNLSAFKVHQVEFENRLPIEEQYLIIFLIAQTVKTQTSCRILQF